MTSEVVVLVQVIDGECTGTVKNQYGYKIFFILFMSGHPKGVSLPIYFPNY